MKGLNTGDGHAEEHCNFLEHTDDAINLLYVYSPVTDITREIMRVVKVREAARGESLAESLRRRHLLVGEDDEGWQEVHPNQRQDQRRVCFLCKWALEYERPHSCWSRATLGGRLAFSGPACIGMPASVYESL